MRHLIAPLILLSTMGPAGTAPPDPPLRSFLYVLQDLDPSEAAAAESDWIVTDASRDGTAAGWYGAEDLSAMRAGGAVVLAYLSVGEAEDYRHYWKPDWHPGEPAWLGPENRDWKGNYKVRYWEEGWRAIVFEYLDRIVASGFDGVWLDVVDAFEYWGPEGEGERADAAELMQELVMDLAGRARATRPGFLVVPQNGARLGELFPGYLAAVDGIGAEDTWYSGNRRQNHWHTDEVTAWLDLFRDAGRPVLAVDYPTKDSAIDDFFARAEARGYVPANAVRDLDRIVEDPRHPPKGGPWVEIASPDPDAEFTESTPPEFTWRAGDGASGFRMTFSGDPSFRRTLRLPRRGLLASTVYRPSGRDYRKIARLAVRSGDHRVFYWITAEDAAGRLRTSRAGSFRVAPS